MHIDLTVRGSEVIDVIANLKHQYDLRGHENPLFEQMMARIIEQNNPKVEKTLDNDANDYINIGHIEGQ